MEMQQNRMTVGQAANLLQCSEETVRNGLKDNRFPFGYAVKSETGNRWTYIILVKKFEESTGIKVERW